VRRFLHDILHPVEVPEEFAEHPVAEAIFKAMSKGVTAKQIVERSKTLFADAFEEKTYIAPLYLHLSRKEALQEFNTILDRCLQQGEDREKFCSALKLEFHTILNHERYFGYAVSTAAKELARKARSTGVPKTGVTCLFRPDHVLGTHPFVELLAREQF
jgi:hypothetical protein